MTYLDRRVWVIGLLGFSCGVPLLLTASTLAYWLKQEGLDLKTIGFMSLTALPYTTKFIWAPLVDRLRLPFLTKIFGRRRSWLFLSQITLMLAIFGMSQIQPHRDLTSMAFLALIISFASATQDIVMLAYQVERLGKRQYGPGEAVGVFGYRMGMLLAGAGALYLATFMTWQEVYFFMAASVSIGLVTTLLCQEPTPIVSEEAKLREQKAHEYLHSHPRLQGWKASALSWLYSAVVCPVSDYIRKNGWFLSLLLMLLYKLGDNLIGNMTNIFYAEVGFSNIQIANASKIFGMWASIFGGFVGGMIVVRYGMLKSLFYCAAIHGVATLSYILLYYMGQDTATLYLSVALEHVTGGMRITALFAYQMTLVNPTYAATQLALLTSIVHLGRTLFAALSGWLVESLGWIHFFTLCTLATFPGLYLVFLLSRKSGEKLWGKKQKSPCSHHLTGEPHAT